MAKSIEKQIGLVLGSLALIWAAYYVAAAREFHAAYLRLGPMQLLMAGLLVWLHGKFRADAHVKRAI